MLSAVARLAPSAQLAWEAPMACGFGACYGCVARLDGRLQRLCLEGPVVRGGRVLHSRTECLSARHDPVEGAAA